MKEAARGVGIARHNGDLHRVVDKGAIPPLVPCRSGAVAEAHRCVVAVGLEALARAGSAVGTRASVPGPADHQRRREAEAPGVPCLAQIAKHTIELGACSGGRDLPQIFAAEGRGRGRAQNAATHPRGSQARRSWRS